MHTRAAIVSAVIPHGQFPYDRSIVRSVRAFVPLITCIYATSMQETARPIILPRPALALTLSVWREGRFE